MINRMPKDEPTERRKPYFDKSRKDRFCGYCGKQMFTDLSWFLIHVTTCEVKDNNSSQPALV